MVQRLNFENEVEERTYLPIFRSVVPLKDTASVTGFREEIQIVEEGDSLRVTLPLGYEPANIEAIRRYLSRHEITLAPIEQLVYARISIRAITNEELDRAQLVIAALRLFFQAATLASDTRGLSAAAEGFEKLMKEI